MIPRSFSPFAIIPLLTLWLLPLCGLTLPQPLHAAPLKVVTSVSDLADFTRRVGGDAVDVYSLTSGKEDPHAVPMRPSAVVKIRAADLFIQMGLDMEHAYAPALLAEARTPRIQPGGDAFLDLGQGVRPLQIPSSLDRAGGDVHPLGNPHYNLDPIQAQRMVRLIAEKLATLLPEKAALFRSNAEAYTKEIDQRLTRWKQQLGGRSIRFVSYHPDFAYFAERFGLKEIGTIQPKPGIEPGARHIEALAAKMKQEEVHLIVKESFFSDRVPQELARKTGAKVVSVPIFVGGTPEAKDYLTLIDALVAAFAP